MCESSHAPSRRAFLRAAGLAGVGAAGLGISGAPAAFADPATVDQLTRTGWHPDTESPRFTLAVVTAHLVLNNTNDFTGGNQPHLVVSFNGDPPQVCFHTTVVPTCTATGVSDTATGTDATGTLTSNTVQLPVAPGASCQPTVTIDKEICASQHDSDCGPGGPGPWVKQAPVGLLGLLLANPHWRITVTDAGPVDITGVTINDPAESSCVRAAGTFSVAAGASARIFCSTSILVSLLPFTNTASATYTPTNSPAGTKPSTTASSSAVACSLLCIL